MSTESEATGGGFWRGFFTGFFLLFIATIALIAFFPMADTAPTTSQPSSSETGGSGEGGTAAPDDGAAITPAEPASELAATPQPESTAPAPAPVVSVDVAAAPQAPSAGAAGSAPQVAATQDATPRETRPAVIAGDGGSEPAVVPGDPPATTAMVGAPQVPVGAAAGDAPVVASAQDQAPAVPLPAPVSGDSATVAPAPRVASGGSSPPAAPTSGASTAPAVAQAQDQAPAGSAPAPVSGDSAAVAKAPSVASGASTLPTVPVAETGTAAVVPDALDNGPLSEQPTTRIATLPEGIADHGITVVAGSEIGAAAKTFVAAPTQGGLPEQTASSATTVPGSDEEIRTAMAPVAEAPDTGEDAVAVDTSTADKPRQRPEPPVADGPAFEAFAADFSDKKDRPLLAIILQDVGADGLSLDSLISIKLPVTYAIAIDDPEAPWSEAAYREAGFEVLAMVPQGGAAAITRGQPRDKLATQLPEYFDAVPGAIGILDRVDGEIQRDNNLVKELIASLKPSGHALLMNKGSGFGSAVDLARLENVPSIAISRVIDPDRSPATIRANLDRAALQASKTGSAVVIGRTYPETVTTLVRWLLGSTARSVAVAPVSAAIRRR